MWWKYLLTASGGAIFGYLLCCLMMGAFRGNRKKPEKYDEILNRDAWKMPPERVAILNGWPRGFYSGGLILGKSVGISEPLPADWEDKLNKVLRKGLFDRPTGFQIDAASFRLVLEMHDPSRYVDVVRRGIAALQEAGSL
ncbi:MAG: hypothetical protein ACYC6G_14060 [Desulfobaccales bacterium]